MCFPVNKLHSTVVKISDGVQQETDILHVASLACDNIRNTVGLSWVKTKTAVNTFSSITSIFTPVSLHTPVQYSSSTFRPVSGHDCAVSLSLKQSADPGFRVKQFSGENQRDIFDITSINAAQQNSFFFSLLCPVDCSLLAYATVFKKKIDDCIGKHSGNATF